MAQHAVGSVGDAAMPRGAGMSAPAPCCRLMVGRWQVDLEAREVGDGDSATRLSPRAARLLAILVEADGGVVDRTTLKREIWPDVHVGDDSLTQAVAEVRRAFGERRNRAEVLETVQKTGYRLIAPIVRGAGREDAGPSTVGHTPPPGTPLSFVGDVDDGDFMDAYVLVLEAERLARREGAAASAAIELLIGEAAAQAPDAPLVQAHYGKLTTLAGLFRGDSERRLTAALHAAEAAAKRRPDLSVTQAAYGFALGALGHWREAKTAFSRAFAVEPDAFDPLYLAAQSAFMLGHLRSATVLAERAVPLQPDDYRPGYIAARAALAMGDTGRAHLSARWCLARLERQVADAPGDRRAQSARAAALAMVGRTSAAYSALTERAYHTASPYFYDVITLASAGEVTAAVDVMEGLVDGGWRALGWVVNDPIVTVLRTDGRYRRLEAAIARG
ncbi:MAG: winged helix-turn-helix domain-containing protein [Pseudomonadota bacterium]